MSSSALRAHSLAEAYLYLLATPCPHCGRGPLSGSDAQLSEPSPGGPSWREYGIEAHCPVCRAAKTFRFLVREDSATRREAEAAVVNSTDEPSHILDVGQWVMLFRLLTEAASKENDRTQARHLGLEAAQCLEEALKFYDDPESDLPPPAALFTSASCERFRAAPEQFSRQRLLELRAKLPSDAVMRSRLSAGRKKPWWRRWR